MSTRCYVVAPEWCAQVFSDGSHCRWPRNHPFPCFAGIDRTEPRVDGWVEIRRDEAGVR